MQNERSKLTESLILAQAIVHNPIVRSVIAVAFFAFFYLALDFPWIVMLVLAVVVYVLLGWLSQREVEPEIDHNAIARERYHAQIDRSIALARRIDSHPRTRELAMKIARSSRVILESADTTQKLQLCNRYFQLIEELYIPNLQMYADNEQKLDPRVAAQFEQEILPRLASRAESLEQDMYRDEQMEFASRSDLLALDLGLLPGLDFNPVEKENA